MADDVKQQQPVGEWLPIDRVLPWEKNPRRNDAAVPRVAESIRRFGFVAPVVIWTSRDRIVAGHTRLRALRLLLEKDPLFVPRGAPGPGMVRVAFHEFVSEAEANAYALADNKLNEIASWDDERLAEVLREIQSAPDVAATDTGFEDKEIAAILSAGSGPAPYIDSPGRPYEQKYGVFVECKDEADQQRAYEVLTEMGFTTRVVTV